MKVTEKVITDKSAIYDWEDEGGALKVPFVSEVKTNKKAILFSIAGLVTLPIFYWLVKKKFQK